MKFILILIPATLISLLVTYVTREWALKNRVGESPDQRRIHVRFMPHLGGFGIFAGFIAGILITAILDHELALHLLKNNLGIIIASFMIVGLGAYDDMKGLNASRKFTGQFIAVTIIVFLGCRIESISLPFAYNVELGWIAIPLTYLWLIGISNAVNLLDGLDGLAAGVSLIASAVFLITAWQNATMDVFIITLSLMAGILGFLKFNYHPASIFMGDTGSLFLGLILAALSLRAFEFTSGNVAILVPIIALAIPIGDTSVAFFRRLNNGRHPFKPDKDHLHHRLIYLGLTHRQAVHTIYLGAIVYGFTAFLMSIQSPFYGVLLLVFAVIMSVLGLKRMGYLEAQSTRTFFGDETIIRVREKIAPLSVRRIWHKLLLGLIDILMINAALLITWWLRFHAHLIASQRSVSLEDLMMTPVPFILTIGWLLLFIMNNLYAMRWDISRFDQVRRVSKVLIFGLLLIFLITMDPNQPFSEGRLTLLMYGLLLIILVNFGRLLLIAVEKRFSVLEYAPHKTLLVGTSVKGRKLLKDIYRNPHLLYDIVGYVDKTTGDRPFYDLKPLGTYDDIPELIRTYGIEEIIIAINERARDEILTIVSKSESTSVIFKIIPQIYDAVTGHKTEEVVGHPLIRLFPERMYLWQWILKRIFDIVLALLLFVLFSPLALLIIAVQVVSGTYPPLRIINTVGKYGRIFGMLNFATRPAGSQKENAVGRLLRRTRLYKFPVLVNIIMGKMSFVGPRPASVEEVQRLRNKIKFYNRRFQVRPGFSGWAQVKYRYEEALKHKREQFKQDLFYLENMSLSFDMRILLRSLALFLLRR